MVVRGKSRISTTLLLARGREGPRCTNAVQVLGKLGRLAPSEQVCAVVARQVGKIVAGRHRHDRGSRAGPPSVALEAFEIHPTSVIQLQYKAARPDVAFAVHTEKL